MSPRAVVAPTQAKDGERDRIERTLSFGKPLTEAQRIKLLEVAGKTPVTKTVLHGAAVTTTIEDGP
jgi:hypothetical protein